MLCKYIYKKWMAISFAFLGIFSLIFGILLERSLSSNTHNLSMLAGLLTGLGGALAVVGVIRFIQIRIQDPVQLKLKENQSKDERNIQILRMSYTIIAIVSLFLFIGMAFLFLALNYMIPAMISIGCLYLLLIIFIISQRYYNLKI